MFIDERHTQIVNMLNEEGRVYVKELSKKFNISESMVRKDLQKLEKDGELKRTYGGAIQNRKKAENTSIETRLVKNSYIKSQIAEKMCHEIKKNDIIFLDISSINYLVAKLIARKNMKVTIITNMIEIACFFGEDSNIDLICIGGTYNKRLGGVIGSIAIERISKYRVDKAFIGSCGVNVYEKNISNFNLEEGSTKKAIIKCAKKVYVVIENEKFEFDGSYKFAELMDIDVFITEETPDKQIKNAIEESNIELL